MAATKIDDIAVPMRGTPMDMKTSCPATVVAPTIARCFHWPAKCSVRETARAAARRMSPESRLRNVTAPAQPNASTTCSRIMNEKPHVSARKRYIAVWRGVMWKDRWQSDRLLCIRLEVKSRSGADLLKPVSNKDLDPESRSPCLHPAYPHDTVLGRQFRGRENGSRRNFANVADAVALGAGSWFHSAAGHSASAQRMASDPEELAFALILRRHRLYLIQPVALHCFDDDQRRVCFHRSSRIASDGLFLQFHYVPGQSHNLADRRFLL